MRNGRAAPGRCRAARRIGVNVRSRIQAARRGATRICGDLQSARTPPRRTPNAPSPNAMAVADPAYAQPDSSSRGAEAAEPGASDIASGRNAPARTATARRAGWFAPERPEALTRRDRAARGMGRRPPNRTGHAMRRVVRRPCLKEAVREPRAPLPRMTRRIPRPVRGSGSGSPRAQTTASSPPCGTRLRRRQVLGRPGRVNMVDVEAGFITGF